MKMITAIIRPEAVEDVKRALENKGFSGLTVCEAMGRGEQKGISLKSGNGETRIDLLPKTRLEIAVPDEKEALAVEAILSSARTGKIGDGRIFVSSLERSIRVRTGEVQS